MINPLRVGSQESGGKTYNEVVHEAIIQLIWTTAAASVNDLLLSLIQVKYFLAKIDPDTKDEGPTVVLGSKWFFPCNREKASKPLE